MKRRNETTPSCSNITNKMKCFHSGHIWICATLFLIAKINTQRVNGRDVEVAVGDGAELFCQLDNAAEKLTSVTWQRRTKDRPVNDDIFVIAFDGKEEHINGLKERLKFTGNFKDLLGSIRLSNITVWDEGIYTCVFSLFPSGPVEGKVHLKVLIPPVVRAITVVPPVAGDKEAILASSIAASAIPAAEVSWSLGALSDSVKVQNNITVDSEGRFTVTSRLIGAASKDLNQQMVRCLVSHPGLKKPVELEYRLIIHYPPELVYISLAGDKGETAEFECKADANPKPNVTCDREVPEKKPLYLGADSRLIILRTPDNNGLYSCVVSNQYGTAVGSLYVDVITRPDCTTCWTLFIILLLIFFVAVGVFFSRKSNLSEGCQNFLERLRRSPVET